jgi:hypothetical protein
MSWEERRGGERREGGEMCEEEGLRTSIPLNPLSPPSRRPASKALASGILGTIGHRTRIAPRLMLVEGPGRRVVGEKPEEGPLTLGGARRTSMKRRAIAQQQAHGGRLSTSTNWMIL